MAPLLGILIVTFSGLLTGTFMWPMKVIKELKFEHYWFIGMLFGLLILPWVVVLIAVPHPKAIFTETGNAILIGNLFSLGWGVANVLYGICIVRIGAALAGALLTSLGVSVGVLMPLIFKGSGLFKGAPDLYSQEGIMIITGVLTIIVGVIFISLAGIGREKQLKSENSSGDGSSTSIMLGIFLAILAGVLSSCLSLSFVYSQGPIAKLIHSQGTSETITNIGVWASIMLGGAAVNLVYPAILITKNKSWHVLRKISRESILAAIIGIQLIVGAIMMGRGMVLLGVLGASVGFGIQQAIQITGNQSVGFVSGEWKGVTGKPKVFMYVGLGTIALSIIVLAFASR